jgi:hypothetical protein
VELIASRHEPCQVAIVDEVKIILRWAVLLVDGITFSIFGMLSFAMLFFSPYLAMGGDAGPSMSSFDVVLIFVSVLAMWAFLCGWFIYSSKFRHEQVRGYWLPSFWIPAGLLLVWLADSLN